MIRCKKCCRPGNRQGSFTVFIVMAFAALLILIMTLLTVSGKLAVSSVAKTYGRLWGRSILAEYDLNLKSRYGLFAFYGDAAGVEAKLDAYARHTTDSKTYIEYGGSQCDLSGFALTVVENAKAQMEEAVKYGSKPVAFAEDAVAGAASGGGPRPGSAGAAGGGAAGTTAATKPATAGTTAATKPAGGTYGHRVIRNRWVLESLPSKMVSAEPQISRLLREIKRGKALESLVASSLVNQYLTTYFKDHGNEQALGKTYFRNELEYILSGKCNDESARKNVRNKLLLLRNGLNLFYLYGCPEKRDAAMSLAMAISPGPQAAAIEALILEAWALAESANDINLLYAGKEVPLRKGDENWALSLENALHLSAGEDGQGEMTEEDIPTEAEQTGENEGRYIEPPVVEGVDYRDYLRILLATLGDDTKILRALDLIQINLKYLYCDYFRLCDCYVGLRFSLTVDGKTHEFEEVYEER